MHGTVEGTIRTIQESMEECGISKKILHATGLQTLLKIIENQYNNIPLGYHHHQDQDNTPLLKLLSPNMLRVGRINSRSLDGPIRLPANRQEQLRAVEEVYDAWFKVWKESYLPKLLFKPKWYKSDTDLKVGDLVWFIKEESKLSNDFTMGMVEQVNTGKDGLIRRVVVKYYNNKENFPRFTDRAARSLTRIFSIDEFCLSEDLAELQKYLDKKKSSEEAVDDQYGAAVLESQGTSCSSGLLLDEKQGVGLFGKFYCGLQDACSDEMTNPKAMLADISKESQLDHSPLKVEKFLAKFPSAYNLTGIRKFAGNTSDKGCEGYRSTDEEGKDYMDRLSQLIMSVNMKLQ